MKKMTSPFTSSNPMEWELKPYVSLQPLREGNTTADAVCFLKKAHFEARMYLHVKFLGEPAVDAGGLTREFFSLFF